MNLNNLLHRSTRSFSEYWALRSPRERTMLATVALVVATALVYAFLFEPALAGRERLNRNLPALRQQVAQMRALAKEAAALPAKPASGVMMGSSPSPFMAMSKQNIEAALARNGLKVQSVTQNGDSTNVQLAAVSFTGTLNWLDEMQKTSMISVADAKIVSLGQPDVIDATISLRLQRNE
ncbi:MAG TPA: type II secretion system protein M [Gallionella sp.]|nr:type II secretion system protein M [Gallionella sp.]